MRIVLNCGVEVVTLPPINQDDITQILLDGGNVSSAVAWTNDEDNLFIKPHTELLILIRNDNLLLLSNFFRELNDEVIERRNHVTNR